MTEIDHWTPDYIYKFDHEEYAFAVIALVGGIIAWFGQTVIIYATLKQRTFSIGSKFLLSLCLAEWILLLWFVIHCKFHEIRDISNTDGPGILQINYGGWGTGAADCMATAIVIINFEAISLFSVAGMTIDRYLIIIKKYSMTEKQCHIFLGFIWTAFLLIFSLPFMFQYYGRYYGLASSKLVCALGKLLYLQITPVI